MIAGRGVVAREPVTPCDVFLSGRALPHQRRRLPSARCNKSVAVDPQSVRRRTLVTVPVSGVGEDVIPTGGSGRQWRRKDSPRGHTTVRSANRKQAPRLIFGPRPTSPSRRAERTPKCRRPQAGRRWHYQCGKSDGQRCASRTAQDRDSPPRVERNRSGSGGATRSVDRERCLGGTSNIQQVPRIDCSGTPSCPGRRRH